MNAARKKPIVWTARDEIAKTVLPAIIAKLDDSFAINATTESLREMICFTAYEFADSFLKAREPQ